MSKSFTETGTWTYYTIDQLRAEKNTSIIKSEISESDTNKIAWMERGYNSERKEYYMINSYFDSGICKWVEDVATSLIPGKGIPLSLYTDLRAMKLLKIPMGEIKYFVIYNVHEWDSVFKLTRLIKLYPDKQIEDLLKSTRIFLSRENAIIQSGHTVEDIKIVVDGAFFSNPYDLTEKGLNENEIERLCEMYAISKSDQVFWNFSIAIHVKDARW